MIYCPIRSELAGPLSAGIMNIMMPPHARTANNHTTHWCHWSDHPANNGWAILHMPEDVAVPIHVEADGQLLAECLTVFVTDGTITQEEFAGLLQAVPAMAGQMVRIVDLIPPSWQAQVMDRAGAIAAGFLEADE